MAITARKLQEKLEKKKELIESIRRTSVTPEEFKKRLKEFNIKTAEELIKKSEKALGNSRLIKIVSNISLTKDGKINLSSAYEKAFEIVLNQTGDLKKAKEYAVATRWLAMLKRDFPNDFDSVVFPILKSIVAEENIKPKPELKPEPKDVEIKLWGGSLFFPVPVGYAYKVDRAVAVQLAADILDKIVCVPYHISICEPLSSLRDYLIKILEEKFGLKIKICENCRYYNGKQDAGRCSRDGNFGAFFRPCTLCRHDGWAPKEIPPEKK